jgi:integrase
MAKHNGANERIKRDYFRYLQEAKGRDDSTIDGVAKSLAARREKKVPTLDQVHRVLGTMPAATVLERRDRALVAFTALTGARVAALASFRLEHIDLAAGVVHQDARTVNTKFAKTFPTWFMPIGGDALAILQDWIEELGRDHLWGPADPLFPSTRMGLGEGGGFVAQGLNRYGWATTQPIREIFKRAFEAAGLPAFNPHSFRDMLVHHAMTLNLSPEAMKAWSQNLGHADVMTTFTSYGTVPAHRQGDLIKSAGARSAQTATSDQIAALETMLAVFKANPDLSLQNRG